MRLLTLIVGAIPEKFDLLPDLAARVAELAQGRPVSLAPVTAYQPGRDRGFAAVKCEAEDDWFATAAGPGVTLVALQGALAAAGAARRAA
ncbi:hypothetical protein [Phenylobacterium sp.]|jgi:hypothetical protein|uniref:hypothetical protein n=1 Tax=Phenylobacterium sp. TaxID=1871053 RepID=UPI002F403381